MKNIKLTLEYDGTNYAGFQRQTNVNTVQAEVEKALFDLLKEDVKLIIASRTDSGVHARGMVCNFETDTRIPVEQIPMAMNARMARDIVVVDAQEMFDGFHCRYHAKKKTYSYRICNRRVPSPMERRFAWHVGSELDFEKMKKASQSFIGKHDFEGFRSLGSGVKSTVRTIHSLDLEKDGDIITLTIQGNGFLYNMVRIITGTLVGIGRGKIDGDTIQDIIESKDRKRAGMTAPANGLVLEKIYY